MIESKYRIGTMESNGGDSNLLLISLQRVWCLGMLAAGVLGHRPYLYIFYKRQQAFLVTHSGDLYG
jgi:hypothetical protein